MLTQPSEFALVCAGTHNPLIVMTTGMRWIKKTTAEFPMKKQLIDHSVIPQIPHIPPSDGIIVTFHV